MFQVYEEMPIEQRRLVMAYIEDRNLKLSNQHLLEAIIYVLSTEEGSLELAA